MTATAEKPGATVRPPDRSEIPAHFSRAASIVERTLDEEKRTVDLVFSTEAEVEDWPGEFMILDHSDGAVDLARINATGPLLFNHDRDHHLGTVVSARIVDRQGVATVRFSRSERGESAYQDVKDGILRSVSVFGRIRKVQLESEEEGRTVLRATSWEPNEISLVTVPADTGAVIRRAFAPQEGAATVAVARQTTHQDTPTMSEENKSAPEEKPAAVNTPAATVTREAPVDHNKALKADRKRIAEIQRTAQTVAEKKGLDLSTEVERAVADGTSVEDFTRSIFERTLGAKPSAPVEIGLNDKEKRCYSIRRALNLLAENKPLDGLEREVHEAASKQLKREAKGFFVPHEVADFADERVARELANRPHLRRNLEVSTSTAGGYTVATNVLGGSLIELLRNRTVMNQLGVTSLSGLNGNVAIPKQTGGATAYWLAEGEEVPESEQSFGQVVLTPHRLVADTGYSKQLLAQSAISVEAFVRDDLMRVLALAKDLAFFAGTGAAGEPLGIMNLAGTNTVTFGDSPTWAKIVEFETAVEEDNAILDGAAYITSPGVKGAWKTTEKATGTAQYLWANNSVNGYPAHATNQIAGNKVIFGGFAEAISADWDGMDVVVDPYSLKKKGLIEVCITLMCDFGFRHAESFAISTDAGNQ